MGAICKPKKSSPKDRAASNKATKHTKVILKKISKEELLSNRIPSYGYIL